MRNMFGRNARFRQMEGKGRVRAIRQNYVRSRVSALESPLSIVTDCLS